MPLSYEDKESVIEREITRRKSKWQLKAISWMDFDDVSQIIRIHIMEKWPMWDQERPIEPWLNVLISNRITNLVRDHYLLHSRPCLRCAANQGGDLCSSYHTQCAACPLYAKWLKKKKPMNDVKMPVSIQDSEDKDITFKVSSTPDTFIEYSTVIPRINVLIQQALKPEQFKVYRMLYIENMSDEKVAEIMGYKESTYKKKNRYKQIENHKKYFIETVRKIIRDNGMD